MNAQVVLRLDFNDVFEIELQALYKETGISYFAHQFIENYYQPNHRISSFMSHKTWQDVYWNRYWDSDPIERKGHKNAIENGTSLTSWQIADSESDCMKARMFLCNVWDGFMIAIHHSNDWLENFSCGWKDLHAEDFYLENLDKLSELIHPIRQYHRQVFEAYDWERVE